MSTLDPMFLQFGALGLLMVVLFFAGQVSKLFVTNAMENQKRLIDGTLEQIKQLASEIGDNTKATIELAKATQMLTSQVNAANDDRTTEHRAMIDGLKRLGGFRPSTDQHEAVRPPTGYHKIDPKR